MADYIIHAKLKNDNILRRILKRNKNVAQFCKENGLDDGIVGRFINLKQPALLPDGSWSKPAQELADALICDIEDLFVEEQQTARLKENEAFIEMTRQQMLSMSGPIVDKIDQDQLRVVLFDSSRLTSREKKVLRLRFEEDMTLQEIGDAFDLGQERIRQIEARALRKLRGPESAKKINEVIDIERIAGERLYE